jgi:hypothetical protein
MTLAVDPETGELVGPASEIEALLDGDEAIDPAFRIATIGLSPAASVLGRDARCVFVSDRPEGRRALVAMATEHVPVALAAWLKLGPRQVPDEPAIRLDPGAMSVLIGRRQAHGHGLEPDVATRLQRRLEAGVRHWTVRVEAGGWGRNLEVLEGDGGIWRVRTVGEHVELQPTSTTAVVRELVGLCERARREGRPAAP